MPHPTELLLRVSLCLTSNDISFLQPSHASCTYYLSLTAICCYRQHELPTCPLCKLNATITSSAYHTPDSWYRATVDVSSTIALLSVYSSWQPRVHPTPYNAFPSHSTRLVHPICSPPPRKLSLSENSPHISRICLHVSHARIIPTS